MPNWCKNNIEIIGPKREIKSLWEEIMQNKDKGLLSAICPQPDNMFHGNLGERERQLCARKNIPNWYDWNIKNWGTKWDVSTEDLSFVFDAPEFGKYFVDPREWDASGRIKFTHDKILKPIREACQTAEFDLIEGNHDERILKHLISNSPALMDVLNSIHGMKISDIFGLDKFKINYIAKGDLHTWTASESKKEVAKNNKVYYDSFIVDHYPQTRNKVGLPGVNGHHHKYLAYSMHNHTYGSYLWHQLGCLHVRDASYANGQPWNNGFMIAHVDTENKSTIWEYINVGDFAIVGGQYYLRKEGEFLID